MKGRRRSRELTTTVGLVCSIAIVLIPSTLAQTVTTVAGGYVGDGPSPLKAAFIQPQAVVLDKNQNAYISERYGHRIRKITPTGVVSTFAGTGISGYSGDGGPANAAMISYPTWLLIDSAGNMVFADGGNSRVRKIDTTGKISTIAGNGTFGNSGDGGPATEAELEQPWGVLYDSAGNLYISDIYACVVRKVDIHGIITTIAGTGTCGYNGDSGPPTQAALNQPTGIVFDSNKNLYISDTQNFRVRQVSSGPPVQITTFAGNGQNGFSGDGGPANQASIGTPRGLAYRGGVLYIANAGRSRVRTVTNGIINTLAGSSFGFDGDQHPPLSTQFATPGAVLPLSASTVVFTDRGNDRIRELVGGIVKTVAGGYLGDSVAGTSATLVTPENIAFDRQGNLYIADANGNRVRKVDTTGKITTIAGNGVTGYTNDGGLATQAELNRPYGVAADGQGNIFVADTFNGVIRKVNSTGVITTFSTNPSFYSLQTLATDAAGNVFAVDEGACVVWKIDSSGIANVIAGVPFTCGYNGDSITATTAQLNLPYGIALDSQGNLYIADSNNNRIRKVNSSGVISTVAGDGNCGYAGDNGPPSSAEVCFPEAIAMAGSTMYIADTLNNHIRKVAGNVITTYAGSGGFGYNGNNLPALSTNFDDLVALAVDRSGVLYLADDLEARVRRVH